MNIMDVKPGKLYIWKEPTLKSIYVQHPHEWIKSFLRPNSIFFVVSSELAEFPYIYLFIGFQDMFGRLSTDRTTQVVEVTEERI